MRSEPESSQLSSDLVGFNKVELCRSRLFLPLDIVSCVFSNADFATRKTLARLSRAYFDEVSPALYRCCQLRVRPGTRPDEGRAYIDKAIGFLQAHGPCRIAEVNIAVLSRLSDQTETCSSLQHLFDVLESMPNLRRLGMRWWHHQDVVAKMLSERCRFPRLHRLETNLSFDLVLDPFLHAHRRSLACLTILEPTTIQTSNDLFPNVQHLTVASAAQSHLIQGRPIFDLRIQSVNLDAPEANDLIVNLSQTTTPLHNLQLSFTDNGFFSSTPSFLQQIIHHVPRLRSLHLTNGKAFMLDPSARQSVIDEIAKLEELEELVWVGELFPGERDFFADCRKRLHGLQWLAASWPTETGKPKIEYARVDRKWDIVSHVDFTPKDASMYEGLTCPGLPI